MVIQAEIQAQLARNSCLNVQNLAERRQVRMLK
jgi:hypothetical protein